ncbi:MAG: 16S rRNA (adenine(1518)-N(6)/adenine(1519)-N(6))-dimethyltransferase RsmA [Nitrospinae bacterium]|nr:16S rRNA (adenine(1518)-N(6)/adenine(1519)-N(6))-dimethyltransferase RsmA [Nitrospinota bacterium]
MAQRKRQKLGQHFLHEKRYLAQIVELADITPGEDVLEIGVGEGALTRYLLDAGAKIYGIEIDEALIPALRKMEDEHERFHLIHGDALDIDYAGLPDKMKLVANLPYQVASAIISQLTEKVEIFPLMVLMVQREVGERLCAAPGGKDYGSLTLWVGYRYKTRLCQVVPPGAFRPPPKVDSAIIRLEAREKPLVDVGNENLYFRIIQAGFAHRRKTLLNNLKSLNLNELSNAYHNFSNPETLRTFLESAGIDPSRRAETLGAHEFAIIARAMEPLMENK